MLHGKLELGLGLGLGFGPHLQQKQLPPPSSSSSVGFTVRSALIAPITPDQLWPHIANPNIPKLNPQIGASARSKEWRVYANRVGDDDDDDGDASSKKKKKKKTTWMSRWFKHNESSLHEHEPLPLPMAYPDSSPNLQDVEKMMNCNTEKEDCKDVLYQWTGKCSRCHGTGEVSYYPKKGREVICKCIPCMGIGYVHKMTVRSDLDVMEDLDGSK